MLSAGDLIDHAWTVVRAQKKTYLLLVLLAALPAIGAEAFRLAIQNMPRGFLLVALLWGLFVLATLINLFATLVILHTIALQIEGRRAPRRVMLAATGASFLPVLATFILVNVIELVGLALLIIPGILFSVWFAFAVIICAFERKTPIDALKASRALSANRFFGVLWRLLAPGAFFRLAALSIAYLLLAIARSLTPVSPLVATSTVIALSSLAMPFLLGALVILYVDLKRAPV